MTDQADEQRKSYQAPFFYERNYMTGAERIVYDALRNGVEEFRTQNRKSGILPDQCEPCVDRIARFATTQFKPIIVPKHPYDDYKGLTDQKVKSK